MTRHVSVAHSAERCRVAPFRIQNNNKSLKVILCILTDRESIIVLDEYQRHSRRGSNNSVASNGCTDNSKAIAAAAAAVTAACNKWLSESSGIFTESAQTGSSTNR